MAMDAFVLANRLAEQRLFNLQRVSLDGQAVDLGFAQIQVDGDLSLAEDVDLILLTATGCAINSTLSDNAALLPWLALRSQRQQLASLCSSAFLLAAAGVLDGPAPLLTGRWPTSFVSVIRGSICRLNN